MTKEWYSAAELAGMPGMPAHARVVNLWGDADKLKRRKRPIGKGWEYHISSLPQQTRQHFAAQTVATVAASDDLRQSIIDAAVGQEEAEREARLRLKEEGLKTFAALPESASKARARARKWVVEAFWLYLRSHGGARERARFAFAESFNQGGFPIPKSVIEHMPMYRGLRNLSEASLQRWDDDYRLRGIMALVDNYGQHKGKSKVDTHPELRKVVLGCMVKHPNITGKKLKAFLEAAHPDLDIVSERGLERYIKGFREENAQLWTYLTHPDRWKNVYMVAHGSHFDGITRLNQVWEMDSTPGDWMLTDGRHSVLGVIDRYSRRLKFYVSKTSKATAVCQVFRRALLTWGKPEAVLTDNGRDYVSELFDGVLNDLEIGHPVCVPFASEEKGTIERAMRTMSHGILDLLPGFIGHNVAERKVIEARKSFADRIMTPGEVVEVQLSSAELQEKLDQWADHVYAHDEHGGLNGKTPWQMANEWTGKVYSVGDERALDMLLLEIAGERDIEKKGIRYNNRHYIHPDLGRYVGQKAHLRLDEQDLGRVAVYVDGTFICWAEAPELTGIDRAEWATVAKKEQKRFIAEQAEEMRRFKKALTADVPGAILRHRIEQSANVTSLPRPTENHTTPALEQAGLAAAARHGRAPERAAPISETDRAELAHDMAAAPVVPLRETPQQRYGRAFGLEQRIERGTLLTESERRWLEGYQQSSEYRAMKDFYSDFGHPPEWREAQ